MTQVGACSRSAVVREAAAGGADLYAEGAVLAVREGLEPGRGLLKGHDRAD